MTKKIGKLQEQNKKHDAWRKMSATELDQEVCRLEQCVEDITFAVGEDDIPTVQNFINLYETYPKHSITSLKYLAFLDVFEDEDFESFDSNSTNILFEMMEQTYWKTKEEAIVVKDMIDLTKGIQEQVLSLNKDIKQVKVRLGESLASPVDTKEEK